MQISVVVIGALSAILVGLSIVAVVLAVRLAVQVDGLGDDLRALPAEVKQQLEWIDGENR